MKIFGWAPPTPGRDVVEPRRLNTTMIRDLTVDATHLNLLAMIFFVARYADAHARAQCTFVPFPHVEGVLR